MEVCERDKERQNKNKISKKQQIYIYIYIHTHIARFILATCMYWLISGAPGGLRTKLRLHEL